MYTAWIKIDDSLPWIELQESFQTKTEAQQAMREKLNKAKVKVVEISKSSKKVAKAAVIASF